MPWHKYFTFYFSKNNYLEPVITQLSNMFYLHINGDPLNDLSYGILIYGYISPSEASI